MYFFSQIFPKTFILGNLSRIWLEKQKNRLFFNKILQHNDDFFDLYFGLIQNFKINLLNILYTNNLGHFGVSAAQKYCIMAPYGPLLWPIGSLRLMGDEFVQN